MVVLCASSVLSSSISQLFFKAASIQSVIVRRAIMLLIGAFLQLCSVVLVVVALRTMKLSQLVAFAAFAYVLVPIGSYFVFNDLLLARFWVGVLLIVTGIVFICY